MKTINFKPGYVALFICGFGASFFSVLDFLGKVLYTQTNLIGMLLILLIMLGLWTPVILRKFFQPIPFLRSENYPYAIPFIAFGVQMVSYQIPTPSQYFLSLLWEILYSSFFVWLSLSKMLGFK